MREFVPVLTVPGGIAAFNASIDEHVKVTSAARRLLPALAAVADLVADAFASGGQLLAFGNGGSAADAQHLAAELIGRFRRDRRALPATALTTDSSVLTAIANDYAWAEVFARQVEALAGPGDVVVALTTSGNSGNVVAGLAAARSRGATTILFGAGDGGAARAHADHALLVPSDVTARVQEVHALFVHLLSDAIDAWAVSTEAGSTETATAPATATQAAAAGAAAESRR